MAGASTPNATLYKGHDLDSDADGTVDEADNSSHLEGQTLSEVQENTTPSETDSATAAGTTPWGDFVDGSDTFEPAPPEYMEWIEVEADSTTTLYIHNAGEGETISTEISSTDGVVRVQVGFYVNRIAAEDATINLEQVRRRFSPPHSHGIGGGQ